MQSHAAFAKEAVPVHPRIEESVRALGCIASSRQVATADTPAWLAHHVSQLATRCTVKQ